MRRALVMAGPQLVRCGERLVARPRAAERQRAEIDVARLIEEERAGSRLRWPQTSGFDPYPGRKAE